MKQFIQQLFQDKIIIEKIQRKLPFLFQLAEMESSRAGKLGMEIGSARERVLIALLMYKFGEKNVNANLPITNSEEDVRLHDEPLSIKTITGKTLGGIKLIWTVDTKKAKEFRTAYTPSCDMLLVQINWGNGGYFYYFPLSAQNKVFSEIGRNKYIKLPKPGTNPRGVEITKEALGRLVKDKDTLKIKISWGRTDLVHNVYEKWIHYWEED